MTENIDFDPSKDLDITDLDESTRAAILEYVEEVKRQQEAHDAATWKTLRQIALKHDPIAAFGELTCYVLPDRRS